MTPYVPLPLLFKNKAMTARVIFGVVGWRGMEKERVRTEVF
jgi:hypothetical protein